MNPDQPLAAEAPAAPSGKMADATPGRLVSLADLRAAHIGGSVCRCRGTAQIVQEDETKKLRDSAAAYVVGAFLAFCNDVEPMPLELDPTAPVVASCRKAVRAFVKKHHGEFVIAEGELRWLKQFEPAETKASQ